jgi:NADPH-dependent 2,4-dienoyl-CoA reductase/sulfur reductase-like enzyme
LGKGTLRAAPAAKHVVVVGGGPAGLESAWVAAARGHRVTLLERDEQLGGKIRLAALLPGRAEIADFADWRVGECARQGVEIKLGFDADAEAVIALAPDAVVVATGGQATTTEPSKSHPFPLPGLDQPWVIDHERAITDLASLGERIVVIDAVGDIAAIGIAHLLAESGRQVTCATPLASPVLVDAETVQKALPRAVRAGVRWRPNTALAMAGDHEAVLVDVLARTLENVPTDHLVIRTHGRPRAELAAALAGRVAQVLTVGDAVAVRWADRAIYDGHLAGRAV